MTGFANYMMLSNFNFVGPLLVIAFYWFIRKSRDSKTNLNKWPWWKKFAVLLLIFVVYLPIYFWVRTDFGGFTRWIQELKDYLPWIIGHLGAIFVLSLYNGELGYHKKWFKNYM